MTPQTPTPYDAFESGRTIRDAQFLPESAESRRSSTLRNRYLLLGFDSSSPLDFVFGMLYVALLDCRSVSSPAANRRDECYTRNNGADTHVLVKGVRVSLPDCVDLELGETTLAALECGQLRGIHFTSQLCSEGDTQNGRRSGDANAASEYPDLGEDSLSRSYAVVSMIIQ